MKKKKVIDRNELPARYPVVTTIVAFLALDYWKAPQWVWGAVGVLFLIIWIACIIAIYNQEEIEILPKDDK